MIDSSTQARDRAAEPSLHDAIERLYFGYRAFTRLPDRILAKRGLGRVHHRVLYFVGRNPGVSVNELLRTLDVSKQALNAPLRRLVDDGLVAMSTSERDRRVRELALTREGAKLEARLTETQAALLRAAFASAGARAEDGWRTVMSALARVDENGGASGDSTGGASSRANCRANERGESAR